VQINVEDAKKFAQNNNIIADSRYTIYLRDLPVFLVFLTADIDTRANRAFGLEKYQNKIRLRN